AVTRLALDSSIDPIDLHLRTGGNPFFVTEVLAAGGQGVPAKVADAVLARVTRLSPGAREALELASVVGREVDARMLEVLVDQSDRIEECIEAGLLVSGDREGALCFRHELARQALLGSMSQPLTARRHAVVLARLELGLRLGQATAVEPEQAPDL